MRRELNGVREQATGGATHVMPRHALDGMVRTAATCLQLEGFVPRVGIVLGSGLGQIADDIVPYRKWRYDEIPHFIQPTAAGHAGCWIAGTLQGVSCVAMQGRFHLYEGHSPQICTLPVRVMRQLGVEVLIVSNASGGLNPLYRSGDVMIVTDHINLMFRNPLVGNCGTSPSSGERQYYDMSVPYDPLMIGRALEVARANDLVVHRGVYAALTGPSYETRAEYRMLRKLGADVVGMSTVPEVLVATQLSLRVLALSAVTNECRPDKSAKTEHEEVVEIAGVAAPKMRLLVNKLLNSFDQTQDQL